MNLNIEDVFKELKRNERKEKMKLFKNVNACKDNVKSGGEGY